MSQYRPTYGKTPRKSMRTSSPYSSSNIPWHSLQGRIISKICDGKSISRMISEDQVDRVKEPGQNHAPIMLWIARFSKYIHQKSDLRGFGLDSDRGTEYVGPHQGFQRPSVPRAVIVTVGIDLQQGNTIDT